MIRRKLKITCVVKKILDAITRIILWIMQLPLKRKDEKFELTNCISVQLDGTNKIKRIAHH